MYGVSERENGKISLDFWIRESTDTVAQLGDTPTIEWRAGALIEENVLLVVVLLKIGKRVYETFWDYFKENGSQFSYGSLFEMMATEPEIELLFFGDQGEVERSLPVPNGLRSFFSETLQQARAFKPWNTEAFEGAKRALVENYPDIKELWEILRK